MQRLVPLEALARTSPKQGTPSWIVCSCTSSHTLHISLSSWRAAYFHTTSRSPSASERETLAAAVRDVPRCGFYTAVKVGRYFEKKRKSAAPLPPLATAGASFLLRSNIHAVH